jgi:maleate isomerase
MPADRRFGLLVLSSDSVVETDFKKFLPRSVSFNTARLFHSDQTPRGAATMDEVCAGLEHGIDSLAQINPELILFACTTASFYRGVQWGRTLRERIEKHSGLPAIVTSDAVAEAFSSLNIRKVFMITPYPEEMNKREIEYFAHQGISIPEYSYFHLQLSRDICLVQPEQIYARAIENAERIRKLGALFISCTGLRTLEITDALERELGVPVVSSNGSILCATLKRLGVSTQGLGAGRLFELHPAH